MDEYIKREDALKIIDNYSKAVTEEGKVVVDAIRDIIAVITPTADVAPKSEVDRLEYTLLGVMHSVDKWLDGAELEQSEVNRAITMREKTLNIIEGQQNEIRKLEKARMNSLPSYCQVISEEKAIELGKEYGRQEAAREILSDLKKAVHDKAVYSYSKDMYPYINLKTFDAILAEYISRLDKR